MILSWKKPELGRRMSLFWQTHGLGNMILSWLKQELGGDLADSGRRMILSWLKQELGISTSLSWKKCTVSYGVYVSLCWQKHELGRSISFF